MNQQDFWHTDLSKLEPKDITHQVISIDGVPFVTIPLEKHPTLENTQTISNIWKIKDTITNILHSPMADLFTK